MGGVDFCAPDSTGEQDAIKGPWVRVARNLNLEGSLFSGWLVCIFQSSVVDILIKTFVEYLLSSDQTTRHQSHYRHPFVSEERNAESFGRVAQGRSITPNRYTRCSSTLLMVQDRENRGRDVCEGKSEHNH